MEPITSQETLKEAMSKEDKNVLTGIVLSLDFVNVILKISRCVWVYCNRNNNWIKHLCYDLWQNSYSACVIFVWETEVCKYIHNYQITHIRKFLNGVS